MVGQAQPAGYTPEQQEGLVRRAQAGDRDAYGQLVERYRPALFGVLMTWLHDAAEAEDVAQEVFLHGMDKLAQLREPRCFGGWIRQIALRLAFNRLTRRRPLGVRGANLALLPANTSNPLDEMIRAEERGHLHNTLARLKQLDRDMLEAFYLRSRSLREMSEEFDVPLGTIKRRLHTARQRLRECLLPDETDRS
jgi:RNA polymerase sigma-70 factor (ECF subfamily)